MSKKSSSKRKLELLRRTQEVTEIVERGSIEEQAMADSASSQGVSDEDHVEHLLVHAEDNEERPSRGSKKPKPSAKKKSAAKKSSSKAKKKGRR
ncbi:MAG TPA: hypothetical protein VNF06_03220 [Candidatus Aquilonibacter sp.]|nr:hypothetical protein [Candidatus Aquilonibacter sp.]